MSRKQSRRVWPGIIPKARRREPLDVRLTVQFDFGEAPEDRLLLLDDQPVPMVGGILANRDRILRAFARLLVQGSLRSPAVLRELTPLGRRRAQR